MTINSQNSVNNYNVSAICWFHSEAEMDLCDQSFHFKSENPCLQFLISIECVQGSKCQQNKKKTLKNVHC